MRKFFSRAMVTGLVLALVGLLGWVLYRLTPEGRLSALPTSPPAFDRPDSTDLELWILDPAPDGAWTESRQTVEGVFGPDIWYGAGYGRSSPVWVRYSWSRWPDRRSPLPYITRIEVTDPEVHILGGLTLRSAPEEWQAGLQALGLERPYDLSAPASTALLRYQHPEGLYWITVRWPPEGPVCTIGAPVSNVTGEPEPIY